MKKIFKTLAVLASLTAVNIEAEIRTVVVDGDNREATIEIEEGEVGKCVFAKLTYEHHGGNANKNYWVRCAIIRITKGDTTVLIKTPKEAYNYSVDASTYFPVVSGPAKITLVREVDSSVLSMEITPNETALSKSAGHVLVLPKGEDGKQKLMLESSTDLVNWTEDSLGSKDSSDKKRFYRLRAVKE
jgi:hypothetical protein